MSELTLTEATVSAQQTNRCANGLNVDAPTAWVCSARAARAASVGADQTPQLPRLSPGALALSRPTLP